MFANESYDKDTFFVNDKWAMPNNASPFVGWERFLDSHYGDRLTSDTPLPTATKLPHGWHTLGIECKGHKDCWSGTELV